MQEGLLKEILEAVKAGGGGVVTIEQTDPTKCKVTVFQDAKDRTITGNVNVTQDAKDRTITGSVIVVQGNPALLNATVTQLAKDRTITGTATVTQVAKDRTVTGTVTTNKGDTEYTKVRKYGKYTTAQTDTVLWPPASGKKFVITDIMVSTDTAMEIIVKDGATEFMGWDFDAKGGAVGNFQTPIESTTADNDLTITTSTDGKVKITVLGYEK